MDNREVLKFLEELFVVVFLLENLKNRVSEDFHFYIDEIESDTLVSFNLIFDNFERRLLNGS